MRPRFLVVALLLAVCMPPGTSLAQPAKKAGDPPSDIYAKLREIPPGTLILGPYLLGVSPQHLYVQWEVMGEADTALVAATGDDSMLRIEGRLLPADPLTIGHPGRMYRADLLDLEPCSTVRYRLEPFETEGFPHEFQAPPEKGELCNGSLRIAAYGDSRDRPDRHAGVIAAMTPFHPNLLISTGDIVNSAPEVDQWQQFFQVTGPVADSAPVVLSPGNHESQSGKEFGASMMGRYFAWGNRDVVGHYSFDFGPAHFVVLDLYWGRALDGAGLKWLKRDVASVPEDMYVFVLLHSPVYSFGRHRVYSPVTDLRAVFAELRVDAVFSGHTHSYEHFKAHGTHYLTLGGGGVSLHEPNTRIEQEHKQFYVTAGKFHHFLLLEITDSGCLYQTFNTQDGTIAEQWSTPGPLRTRQR